MMYYIGDLLKPIVRAINDREERRIYEALRGLGDEPGPREPVQLELPLEDTKGGRAHGTPS